MGRDQLPTQHRSDFAAGSKECQWGESWAFTTKRVGRSLHQSCSLTELWILHSHWLGSAGSQSDLQEHGGGSRKAVTGTIRQLGFSQQDCWMMQLAWPQPPTRSAKVYLHHDCYSVYSVSQSMFGTNLRDDFYLVSSFIDEERFGNLK